MRVSLAGCLLTCLLLVGHSAQQSKDPIKDFCRRWGHQTAVVDQKLFIDGGIINWSPITENVTNEWLVYEDLTTSAEGIRMPPIYANLTKDSRVPIVSGGALWADPFNNTFYLFGGEFAPTEQVKDSSIWRYNVSTDKWDTPEETAQSIPDQVAWAGSTVVTDRGEGYMYGGWQNNRTKSDWEGPPRASDQLLMYDLYSNEWTNSSGPDDIGRAEGAMVYLPASDGGMLIYFGGVLDTHRNGSFEGADMRCKTIHIYDIISAKWYTQNATGDIPESRRRFCAGVTWAADQSSYNVYLYGGASNSEGPGFDDVYILSMPSFRWIRWWASVPGEGVPHHSLSCNIIESSQMIVMGGTFPLNNDACDEPYGTHNLKLGGGPDGNDDWVEWKLYDPELKEYRVPSNITDVIGGGPEGGATLTAPESWDHQDLARYFTLKITPVQTPTPTPSPSRTPPPSPKPNIGAIIGGAVGGVLALVAIIAIVWICIRRRRDRQAQPPHPPELHSQQYRYPMEMASPQADAASSMPTELDSAAIYDRKPGSWGGSPVVTSKPGTPHTTTTPIHYNQTSPLQQHAVYSPQIDDSVEIQGYGHHQGQWVWQPPRSPSYRGHEGREF